MVELPICKLLYLCIKSIYAVISIFGHVLELTCRWYFSLMHMFRCSRKMRKSPEFQNSPSSQISEFQKFPKFFQNFKNGAGPKNRLVHPELWVVHFGRILDLAIFPNLKSTHAYTRYLAVLRNVSRVTLQRWWTLSQKETKMGSPFGFKPGRFTCFE